MSEFRTLFTLGVTHTYYDGACRDFEFIFPSDAMQLLKRARLQARVLDGRLHILYETDGTDLPFIDIAGRQIRIGLRPVNPYFSNVTTLAGDYFSTIAVYQIEDQDVLGASSRYPLVGQVFHHTLSDTARPVTVSLFGLNGGLISTETVTDAGHTEVTLNTGGRGGGLYRVREDFPIDMEDHYYYSDPELQQQGAVCVADMQPDSSMYSGDTWEFAIPFTAREETLRYHVVTKNYNDTDILALTVADNGHTEDGRPQLTFTKTMSDDVGYDGLDVRLLKSGDEKVILFKSGPNVPRRATGRKKIQLSNGTDVLLANLPQPGPDKADADMIIHLSKPNP